MMSKFNIGQVVIFKNIFATLEGEIVRINKVGDFDEYFIKRYIPSDGCSSTYQIPDYDVLGLKESE